MNTLNIMEDLIEIYKDLNIYISNQSNNILLSPLYESYIMLNKLDNIIIKKKNILNIIIKIKKK